MAKQADKYAALKLENQLCFPLYAAAREVVNYYTPYLSELGITYTQYIAFMVLWENDGMTVGELGRRLFLDNGTLTPMLKKLEKMGFIERKRCADDERVVKIHVTEQGFELREKCLSIPNEVGRCVKVTPEEAATLYGLLYKLLGKEDRD
ncbi:MAG: MarR family transcriptional regulator [Clostridiales bacterium]|nr:MarR family transcriptional regulator [Clostridiales bacterium]